MNSPVMEGLRLNVPAYVKHARLVAWVAEIAALTECAEVYWCDGSQAEYDRAFATIDDAASRASTPDEAKPSAGRPAAA